MIAGFISAGEKSSTEDKRSRMKQSRILLKQGLALEQEGQYDSALGMFDSVLAIDAKNADGFYYRGLTLLRIGDTAAAVSSFASGVEKAPLSSRLKIMLARTKIIAGDPEGALTLLDKILMIKPHESEALYLKGSIFLEKGETANALEVLQKALDYAFKKGVY